MVQRIARLLALLALCLPFQLFALGLGDVETSSALNEKLSAKIKILSARPGEMDALNVILADSATFQRAGIDRPFFLTKLQFKVVATSETQGYIEVTSPESIREPFLDFLIEVNWPNGHLVREYTLLLDPPLVLQAAPSSSKSQATSAPAVAPVKPIPAPQAAPTPSPTPKPSATIAPAPAPAPQPVAPQTPSAAPAPAPTESVATGGEYGPVREGDTLYGIATAIRQDGAVSLEQLMIAMLQANPDAFIENNINLLKQGKVLRTPTQQELDAITHSAALSEVQRQVALWKEYQANALQKALPSSVTGEDKAPQEPEPEPDEKAVIAKLVEPKTEEAPKTETELRLVGADNAAGGTGTGAADTKAIAKLQDDLALASEASDAARKESQELKDRVQALEDQLNQMRGLLELKDQELASLQSQAAKAAQEVPATPEEKPMPLEAEKEIAKAEQQEAEKVAELPAVTAPETPAEEVAKEEPKPEAVVPPKPVEAPAPTPAPEIEAPSKPEPLDSLDELIGDYGATTAIVVAVLMLLILGVAVRKRRKSEGPESILADTAPAVATVATAAVAAPAVKGPPSISPSTQHDTSFLDEFDVSEMAHMQADVGEADPLAEADVFLAYGRYQQAEDLIKEAISQEPDRNDYRLKLMEVYRAANNRTGFLNEAESLYATLAGTGDPLWNKAFHLGKEYCPDAPLFQGEEEPVAVSEPESSFVLEELSEHEFEQAFEQKAPPTSEAPAVTTETKSTLLPSQIEDHELDQLWPAAKSEPSVQEPALEPEVVAKTPAPMMDASVEPEFIEPQIQEPEIAVEPVLEVEQPDENADDFNMDLDINLDESALEAEMDTFVQSEVSAPAASGEVELESDIDSLMPDLDEVGTKLDLARAYIDMGDTEGAQSILNEVLDEGNDAQKLEAKQLLGQIH